MSYEPIEFKDMEVENPHRHKITDLGDGTVEIVPEYGQVVEDGTDLSAEVFNHMQDGIIDAHDKAEQATGSLEDKVDKVTGKGLSTNDYTTAEKDKLAGIEAEANKYVHPGGTNPHGTTKANVGLSNVDNVKQMPLSGGNLTGIAKSQANTSYTTAQLRNVIMSTANPSGGSNGDVWIKYS